MYSALSSYSNKTRHMSMAEARFVHNIPGQTVVDIYVNQRLVLSGVRYKGVSDFFSFNLGVLDVQVKVSGTNNIIAEGVLNLGASKYTLIIHGKGPYSILALEDSTQCPMPGMALVRVIHAAADAPAVDIYANNQIKLFSNISYGSAGSPLYASVNPGNYKINVVPANSFSSVLDVNISLASGAIYTVIASGIPGDRMYPLNLIVSLDGSC